MDEMPEPTIGDVLLAIASLETRMTERLADVERAISRMAQNVGTLNHHRGAA